MKNRNLFQQLLAMLIIVACISACDDEFLDPSSISEDQVFGTADGIIGASVGLQQKWSVGGRSPLRNAVGGAGLSVRSLRVPNAGNTAELDVFNGGNNIIDNNVLVSNLWEQTLLVRNQADRILENLEVIPDAATRDGFEVWARMFRAMCNGTLMQFYDQAPLFTSENAMFFSRAEVLADAISNLEAAESIINQGPLASTFLEAVPANIDVPNTVQALLARYYLMNGDFQNALDAAGNVDLSVQSFFGYDEQNDNPLAVVIIDNSAYQVFDNQFGLAGSFAPDTADQRLSFYLAEPDSVNTLASGFFDDILEPVPVYLPGEMLLIQAEAHARLNEIPEAISALDGVLTKTPDEDAFGVGANLPAYSGASTQDAVLEEIYRNRRIELFMSGLSLEDSRRFNRPGPLTDNAERTRDFYPYPQSESNNNPNTPASPSI